MSTTLRCRRLRASGSVILPCSILPGGGTSCMIDSEVTLLPQPLSPTMPSTLPLGTRKDDPIQRPDRAQRGVKIGVQVLYA